MGLFSRFRNVLQRDALDRELEDELAFHRQMRLRRARERGLSEAEAELDTKRRMGNLSLPMEQMRDARVIGWLASCLQDLRHGVVLLKRDAGVSALIILVLALGIGGNAAIFTLLKAAFLDPLPYLDSGRLVTIAENTGWDPSTSEFLELQARSRSFQQMAFAEHRDMQLSGTGEPVRVFAARVSSTFFPLLGTSVSLGRTFAPEDNQPGRTPLVVLTDAFWRTRMNANPGAVGRTLRLDGNPAVVIGVLPPAFHFDYPTLKIPEPVDIYVSFPLESPPSLRPSSTGRAIPVLVLARLREGVSFVQAEADVHRVAGVLTHLYPAAFPNRQHDPNLFTFDIYRLRDAIVGTQRRLLWLLWSSVGVLLLIACANTAQLQLARSLRRGREIAIRAALGASRIRLVRQFLLEGLVLASCGGAAGLLIGISILRILLPTLPVRSPLFNTAQVDMSVIVFTLGISFASALVFSAVPAAKASGWTMGPNLNARFSTGEGNRWRHVMIAIEAALSVFLLCGAGLIAQNLLALLSTPTGCDPTHVLAMRLKLPSARPQDSIDPSAGRIYQQYVDKIETIPGVESAATVTGPPLHPERGGNAELVGYGNGAGELKIVWSTNHLVSPDYFRTLRIPLLAGRVFRRDDAAKRVSVAIVNREFAHQFGLGADVVGKQLFEPGAPITIVGMVGNVRTNGLQTAPYPEVYLSSLQLDWVNVHLLVRSVLPADQLLKQIKAAIGSTHSDQAVYGVETLSEMISRSFSEPRFEAWVLGVFALLAVAMAAAGLYGVISFLVSQRTGEIAIRIVLGVSKGSLVRTIVGITSAWVLGGLVLGLALGLLARSTVRSLSSSVVQGSPWMYVLAALLFVSLTVLAAWRPMRKASRMDPALALRLE